MYCLNHLANRVKSSGAVIADKHCCTPAVTLCEDLRTAATSTLAIKMTNMIIAQI